MMHPVASIATGNQEGRERELVWYPREWITVVSCLHRTLEEEKNNVERSRAGVPDNPRPDNRTGGSRPVSRRTDPVSHRFLQRMEFDRWLELIGALSKTFFFVFFFFFFFFFFTEDRWLDELSRVLFNEWLALRVSNSWNNSAIFLGIPRPYGYSFELSSFATTVGEQKRNSCLFILLVKFVGCETGRRKVWEM